ncbi:pyrroline-5-carboxylate reductase [Sphingomonas quercus]|uniref:Pyrroline-5-carboxylate reductase n=1 Tax=Sphingomonas quercus TaxID=2842451 RepID=A0ABS6BNU3_9SPHN|nr:pyrroline-5-carboxylate reductase [Sphingomonas quercus]MBU3079466.1 pyrroline-5-carboxylate reductase [Sphingomonas quercus]
MAVPETGPVLLVGCGNMAGSMLRGWLAAGLDPAQVTAVEPNAASVPAGVTHLSMLPPDGASPAIVMLGVKPQKLDEVAPALAPLLAPETILLSILAGTELGSLRARFPAPRAIVRVMPNMPAAIGRGVLALHADGLEPAGRELVAAMMGALGLVEWIGDERLFDAVTALSGSGPAFLFRFIDALGKAGAALGLPADQAARMALATVGGAAALAEASDADPGTLAERVASPGGSTRKGLDVLDRTLDTLLEDTLVAAERRNAELAAETR